MRVERAQPEGSLASAKYCESCSGTVPRARHRHSSCRMIEFRPRTSGASMKTVFSALLTLVMAIGAFTGAQAATTWTEGVNYFLVTPPRPTSLAAGKVQVTEVFSYACPACNLFQPTMHKLQKSLPPNAVVDYLPAAFNTVEDWPMFQLAFARPRHWASTSRRTMQCSMRCGRAVTWRHRPVHPGTQEPHADDRGCRKVLLRQRPACRWRNFSPPRSRSRWI